MDQATYFDPRSPYFDTPLSPPLFFPTDAAHELDPFPFDDQRLSSPDLLTPSSNTDSNESIDFAPAYTPEVSYVAAGAQPIPPSPPTGALFLPVDSQLPPPPDADTLVTTSTPSASSSPFSSSLESTSLTLNMYSHPTRPAVAFG